jgi:hypothetical protein
MLDFMFFGFLEVHERGQFKTNLLQRLSSSEGKFQANLGIFAPMNELKSIFIAVSMSLPASLAGTVIAQPTLVDPIEVFEGSLSDPENAEIAIHWDVTNLTEDTLTTAGNSIYFAAC